MGREEVVRAFLSGRKARQNRGLLMTDGCSLYWGADLIATREAGRIALVERSQISGRPAPVVVWNLVKSLI